MRKILSLFTLLLLSCTYLGNTGESAVTSIRDQNGKHHIYFNLKLGQDNWCYEHKQYELVESNKNSEDK